jgi:hypothetical protein
VLAAGIVALASVSPVLAGHMTDWRHDHSNEGVPSRPDGLAELRNRFGGPACNERANNARTWFPSAVSRTQGGYVLYHPYLAINVGDNIRTHIAATHRNGALDYGDLRVQLPTEDGRERMVDARLGRRHRHQHRPEPLRAGPLGGEGGRRS